ncbi:MAG: galactokinase, partial [Bacteroidales bacterium]|nr:galactokinase [Bacteroidales bacterium]
KKRARHVITENQRVVDGVEALKKGDIELFGKLMLKSHNSLKSDYEVSCSELDVLVEEAMKTEGVLGSRMTGGGFGGCTVNIVQENQIETFKHEVGKNYKIRAGLRADFYITEIGDGVKRIE